MDILFLFGSWDLMEWLGDGLTSKSQLNSLFSSQILSLSTFNQYFLGSF